MSDLNVTVRKQFIVEWNSPDLPNLKARAALSIQWALQSLQPVLYLLHCDGPAPMWLGALAAVPCWGLGAAQLSPRWAAFAKWGCALCSPSQWLQSTS